MKSEQLEILLFTDTQFSSRQFSKQTRSTSRHNLVRENQLEEACWNGLCKEALPELYRKVRNHKKLSLWRITRADWFFELEYGEQAMQKDHFFSLNPHAFLACMELS